MLSLRTVLIALAFVLIPVTAIAQTPDFLTPSVETVCDDFSGAAFGLCNAYCEAMDCHLDNPQASATACAKVLGKFQSKTGGANPPCESTCPCSNNGEFDQLVNGGNTVLSCGQNSSGSVNVVSVNPIGGIVIGAVDAGPPLQCGVFSDTTFFATEIDQEQFDNCAALLLEVATAQGVSCPDGPGPI